MKFKLGDIECIMRDFTIDMGGELLPTRGEDPACVSSRHMELREATFKIYVDPDRVTELIAWANEVMDTPIR